MQLAGDVYAAADDLVIRLRGDGADRWADAINEAIESGSTGTEILMALRHQIDRLLEAGDACPEADRLARTLKKDLDELLSG
jgi:hypothetical protein